MESGWINLFGAVIVLLIIIPNVIYAVRKAQDEPQAEVPRSLSACEQAGRYGCIVLMWLPLLVRKFGFASPEGLLIFLMGNGILLLGYYWFWARYFRKRTLSAAMALAVLPTLMFLLSGILLRHWLLACAAVLFGSAHCRITYMTHKEP